MRKIFIAKLSITLMRPTPTTTVKKRPPIALRGFDRNDIHLSD